MYKVHVLCSQVHIVLMCATQNNIDLKLCTKLSDVCIEVSSSVAVATYQMTELISLSESFPLIINSIFSDSSHLELIICDRSNSWLLLNFSISFLQ